MTIGVWYSREANDRLEYPNDNKTVYLKMTVASSKDSLLYVMEKQLLLIFRLKCNNH